MNSFCILVVNTNPDHRLVIQQWIAESLPDCQAVFADNAVEGLKISAANPIDLALIEWNISGVKGTELCRHLKNVQPNAPFPVILLTTQKPSASQWSEILDAGADDCIAQPFNPSELQFKIKRILQIKQAEDNLQHLKDNLEKQIEQRTQQLTRYASQVPGILYQFQKRTDGTYCLPFSSEAIRNLFGCSPEDVRDDCSPIMNVVYPEDLQAFLDSIQDSADRLTPWQCEYRVQIPGKPARWMWGNSIPEKQPDGSILWHGYNVDITDRKQAEEALAKANERLDLAKQAAGVGVWDWNVVTGVTEWTNQMFVLFGLDSTKDPASFDTWQKILHTEDRENATARIEQALKNRANLHNEYRIVRPDGEIRWINALGKGIYAEDGLPLRMVGICIDITGLKRAEEALRESEQRYRTVADYTFDWEYWTLPDGSFQYISPSCERICGYTPSQFQENPSLLDEIVHPDDRELWDKHKNQLEAIDRGISYISVEFRIFRQDKEIRWIGHICRKIINSEGEYCGIRASNRDITQRKLIGEALRKSESLYHSLVENIPQFILRKDLEGRFTFANEKFCLSLGKKVSEIVGKTDYDFYPTEFAERYRNQDRQVIETGQIYKSVESYATIAGETLSIHVAKTPVRDASGAMVGVQVIFQDITELKRMEKQLLQSQKLQAMGTLAGGIAHDFNNILMGIMGFTELTIGLIDPSEEEIHDNLNMILASATRAKNLVKQILSFSRKSDSQKQPVSLITLTKECLKLLRSSLPSTIEIRHNLGDSDITIFGNGIQIHQAIMNLGTNSAYAMRDRGGVLEFHLDEQYIDSPKNLLPFFEFKPGNYACLQVRDTGCGIEAGILDRIFDPFFTTKDKSEGTGLGLSVVLGIVKSHDGAIALASQSGEGATFTLYLPITTEKAAMDSTPKISSLQKTP